jgi:arabinogalactan oligomer / maltooligosaccharide transport system permease protein
MATQSMLRSRQRSSRSQWNGWRIALHILRHGLLLAICLFAIAPLLWGLSASLKPRSELFTNPSLIPNEPTLSNYAYVLGKTKFPRWFWNTLVIALSTTVLAVGVATLGGYAMSRFRFWGRSLYGNTLLVVQMFPGVMLAIPLFLIFTRLRLIDTRWALLITYLTFALAFAVWMLKGYFDSIPREIEEAALIDGASRLQVLWRIILPLSAPGITTVSVFAFLLAWNDFFFAFLFLVKDTNYTLQMGLFTFIKQFHTEWNYLMTAAMLTSIPVFIFFFGLQRYLTRGLIAGATKG